MVKSLVRVATVVCFAVVTGFIASIAYIQWTARPVARAAVHIASGAADERALAGTLDTVRGRLGKLRALVPSPTDHGYLESAARRKSRNLRQELVATHGQARRRPLAYDPTETMFISICSFRDLQCAPTLYDMYEKAKWPRNVFVGAVQQHVADDPTCIPPQYKDECTAADWCPSDNIKTRTIEPKMARGPTFGRYYGMLMYRNERYFMMIDSHNRWVTHWDSVVLSMYHGLPTKKGVLAHYPESWINPDDNGTETNAPLDNRPTTMYMCTAHWLPELGFVRMGGFIINRKAKFGKDTCRPQPYAGAGFLFAYGKLVQDVPFDPHLPFVFNGEEIMYTVRMWTHGWDIFSPSENILYHYYYRSKAKKFWGILPQGWEQTRAAAERRIQWMLQTYHINTTNRHVPDDTKEEAVIVEADKYGLGTERTLLQYYEFAGIDRVKYKLTRDFCKEYS